MLSFDPVPGFWPLSRCVEVFGVFDSLSMKPVWLNDASCSLMDAVVCFCLYNVLFYFNIRGPNVSAFCCSKVVLDKSLKKIGSFRDFHEIVFYKGCFTFSELVEKKTVVKEITTVVKCDASMCQILHPILDAVCLGFVSQALPEFSFLFTFTV